MVGPLVCLPPPPFFLLYDSVPIYYETEGFSRESRTIELALATRPLLSAPLERALISYS